MPPCYFSNLPWDIIVEILSFSSVASLLRFRSVSKPWRDLIDSSRFRNKHLVACSVKCNRDLKLIVAGFHEMFYANLNELEDHNINDFISIKYPFDMRDAMVVGCCNGLICLWNYDIGIILWNLSTMTYQIISQIYKNTFPIYGFGHDAVNDDYKLVRMVQLAGNSFYYTTYSLKSDCWRKIEQVIPNRNFDMHPKSGVFVGGALHWTVFSSDKSTTMSIIALDVETEEYKEFSKPEYQRLGNNGYGREYGSVDVLGGSLSFVYGYRSFSMFYIDVWVMKEYGVESSWMKLVSISDSSVVPTFISRIQTLAYSKCGKKVLLQVRHALFSVMTLELFWYDLQKNVKSYVKFNIDKIDYVQIDPLVPCVCSNSLVRLKHSINANNTTSSKMKRQVEI